ncbi:MAG: DnaJ domain-containing protein [Bdellovibrionales bacterium]|nr:DnaJ domain-containing protein [Bdellovibrionales bacterium]
MSTKCKVLILDDDKSFADSLSKSLQDYNYETVVCTSSFDAEDKLKTFSPDLLIIDLFMPNGNGSDWATSLLKHSYFKIPIIYISGIFTDVEFQNSLITNPLILKVFSKPFEVANLIKVFEEYKKNKISETKESIKASDISYIERALIGSNYLDDQFINNLKKPTKFSANNLPEYLTCFFKTKSTGVVTIKTDAQEVEIHYSKGNIIFIKMNDKPTSFGVLLAKLTQLKYGQIENYCIEAREAKKNIGVFLLEKSLVTEIEIFKIINLQIALRFFKLFNNSPITCEWTEKEESNESKLGHFSIEEWERILIRFSNNLTDSWLHGFLKKFNSYYLILRKENFPQTISDPDMLDSFNKIKKRLSSSCVQLKDFSTESELKTLKTLYLFLLLDVVALSSSKQLSKTELLNIHNDNKKKNYFEVLDVSLDSTEPNIKQAYRSLSKKFHPDNCSFFASSEERDLYEEIFKSISQAYATLSKDQMRVSYQSLLEQEKFEEQFKEQLLENEIIVQLQNQNLTGLLEKIQNPSVIYAKKQVFLLWALIVAYKEEATHKKKQAIKKRMKVYIKNIPENILNFNHFIYLTKALYCEITENLEEAKYFFNKIQNIESIDISKNTQNIDDLLLQKKKKSVKKRDIQFGASVFILVVAVVSYKLKTNNTNIFVNTVQKNIKAKIVIKKKQKKRELSSVDRKIQIKSYFSNLANFHIDSVDDNKNYKLISLKNYLPVSEKVQINKLSILVYKQLSPSGGIITEKNFLKKQNKIKAIDKFLNARASLKEQSSITWYGLLQGEKKQNLLVQYIKEHRTFIYFIGDHSNIISLKKSILKNISKL